MANKTTRIILDLNGVVQRRPMSQVLKFGLWEMIRLKLSPMTFINIICKLARGGEKPGPAEMEFVRRFYDKDQHIKMAFLPGARKTVKKLLEKYSVYICSANACSAESDKRYADFLTKKIGKCTDIHFVKPGETKLDYYRQMKASYPNDEIIVVDDSKRHIDAAQSIGLSVRWINKKHGYKNLNAAFFGDGGK